MGFMKSDKINKIGLFNENFTGYGFEDFEFGYRCISNGYVAKTKATIVHDEGQPDINNYIKKYYHLGRDGMQNLIKVNFSSRKNNLL